MSSRKKIRLLVVDEQPSFCDTLEDYADMCRHEIDLTCKFVETEEEFEKLVASWCPSIVLVDVHAPQADCFKLIENCHKQALPVITTSDRLSADIEGSTLSRGASAYIAKGEAPEEIEMLLHQIECISLDLRSRH